jgi:hypothetical protein
MGKADKLLEKVRNNPKAVAFADLDKLLSQLGFQCRQPRSGSSHYVYTFGALRLTVPYKRPHVKEIYVKEALRVIDQMLQSDD